MGLIHSPYFIADGLTFCFDAANPNSINTKINLGGPGDLTFNNTTFVNEFKGGVQFTGDNNSQIDVNRQDIIPAGSTDYTLEAWWLNFGITPTGRNYGVLFSNYGPGFSGSNQIWFFTAGLWHGGGFGYASGISAAATAELSGTGYNGTKYGVVCHTISTKQGSTYKTWINGVLVANTSSGANNTAVANVNWRIGNDVNSVNSEALFGKIYLVRAYSRALTESEVLYNYNQTKGRFGY